MPNSGYSDIPAYSQILSLSGHPNRGTDTLLILFSPLAFVSQRQYSPRQLTSPLVFLVISTHFTAPPRIPLSPS